MYGSVRGVPGNRHSYRDYFYQKEGAGEAKKIGVTPFPQRNKEEPYHAKYLSTPFKRG